jgi:hypothetical protein
MRMNGQSGDEAHLPLRYSGRTADFVLGFATLCVALLSIVVYYLGDIVIEVFGNPNIQIAFADAKWQQAEAANRYFFLAAFLTLTVTSSGIIVFYGSDVRRALDWPSYKRIRRATLLLGYSVLYRAGDAPKTFAFFGHDLFAKALCSAPIPDSASAARNRLRWHARILRGSAAI